MIVENLYGDKHLRMIPYPEDEKKWHFSWPLQNLEKTWKINLAVVYGCYAVEEVLLDGDFAGLHPYEIAYLMSEQFVEDLDYYCNDPFYRDQELFLCKNTDPGQYYLSI